LRQGGADIWPISTFPVNPVTRAVFADVQPGGDLFGPALRRGKTVAPEPFPASRKNSRNGENSYARAEELEKIGGDPISK